MKKIKFISVLIFIFSFIFTSFADESIDNWKYYKEIKHNNESSYKSFYLAENIYKYSKNDLSDIRIINEKNEFIPYYLYNKYLHNANESLIGYESKQVHSHIDSKENKKYIDFQIVSESKTTDIIGNRLSLTINSSNFFKKVEVYGGYDNIEWDFIKEDELYRINESQNLNIQLDRIYKYTYYRIVLLDDIEDTSIDNLELIYNNKEVIYHEYSTTKNANYEVDLDKEENDTIIYLYNENNLRIKDMEIISGDDFKRKYYIYFKGQNNEEFRQLDYGEIHQIDLKNFKARKTIISLDSYQYFDINPNIIKIVVKNNDNAPINIDNIKINYIVDKIVFKDTGSNEYRILFGNTDAHRPSYDIEAYKEHIEGEDQEVCQLQTIVTQKATEKKTGKEVNYNLILNITIASISLLLVFIIIRKVKF